MDARRPAWHTAQIAGARPMPLAVLRTPMGDRIWGLTWPSIGQALSGGYLDAEVDLDADRYLDADGIVLEESDRLLAVTGLTSSLRPVEGGLLGSYTAAELPAVTVELDNGDKAMSALIGREYVLHQPLTVYAAFPGSDVLDALPKRAGHVTRWVLTKRSLVLEAEEL